MRALYLSFLIKSSSLFSLKHRLLEIKCCIALILPTMGIASSRRVVTEITYHIFIVPLKRPIKILNCLQAPYLNLLYNLNLNEVLNYILYWSYIPLYHQKQKGYKQKAKLNYNKQEKLSCPAISRRGSCQLVPAAGSGKFPDHAHLHGQEPTILLLVPAEGCINNCLCWFLNPLHGRERTTL